jgi:hypothetical protein
MQDLTPKEMLAEVNKAIATVLIGGQSYKIGSRQLTRADLGLLKSLKNELTAQVASEEESNIFSDAVVVVFGGR